MLLNDSSNFRIEICLISIYFLLLLCLLLSEYLSAFGVKPYPNIICRVFFREIFEVFRPFTHFHLL